MTTPPSLPLPRDPFAEREALAHVRARWGDDAHVEYIVSFGSVMAQARSPLQYGSRLELAVRADTSKDAARSLVQILSTWQIRLSEELAQ